MFLSEYDLLMVIQDGTQLTFLQSREKLPLDPVGVSVLVSPFFFLSLSFPSICEW